MAAGAPAARRHRVDLHNPHSGPSAGGNGLRDYARARGAGTYFPGDPPDDVDELMRAENDADTQHHTLERMRAGTADRDRRRAARRATVGAAGRAARRTAAPLAGVSPTLQLPAGPSVRDGAGLLLGLLLYGVFISGIRYGWPGVTGWLRAKFLNEPMGGNGPADPAAAAALRGILLAPYQPTVGQPITTSPGARGGGGRGDFTPTPYDPTNNPGDTGPIPVPGSAQAPLMPGVTP